LTVKAVSQESEYNTPSFNKQTNSNREEPSSTKFKSVVGKVKSINMFAKAFSNEPKKNQEPEPMMNNLIEQPKEILEQNEVDNESPALKSRKSSIAQVIESNRSEQL
jgi:hypothetical protein